MKISFYGAAQDVTGSKHLIESQGYKLLLDCGLHQGLGSKNGLTNRELPFNSAEIDAVILSHAHADHCGLLPVLVKNGYLGKIYCTAATADIAKDILLDSAAVQEQEQRNLLEQPQQTAPIPPPLYTKEDVLKVLDRFEVCPYFRLSQSWTELNSEIRFKFYDAGHILGSAITYLEIKESGIIHGLGYTGDIGKDGAPLLHNPEVILEPTQVLISESTYGDRVHPPLEISTRQFKEAIDFAVSNNGKIIVPAFALGRTQELIYLLHKLNDAKTIQQIPVYVDSPLALNITEVFTKHKEDFNIETAEDFFNKNELPLAFENLTYIKSVEESKELNNKRGPFMVIASSGMCEGGRILHHLLNGIEDPNNIILITGYQAQGTLGRKIQDGQKSVQVLNKDCRVAAKVVTLDEFSAHADADFLLSYYAKLKDLKRLFLVHGEIDQAEGLKNKVSAKFPGINVEIPSPGQVFEI